MKPTVYLDSSVIGYLTSRLARNPLVRSRQILTRHWWRQERSSYELRVSVYVEREVSSGDPQAADERLRAIAGLARVDPDPRTQELADRIAGEIRLPDHAVNDASHLAVATLAGIDYLMTWNFRHLANEANIARLQAMMLGVGLRLPTITDPQRLSAGDADDPVAPSRP